MTRRSKASLHPFAFGLLAGIALVTGQAAAVVCYETGNMSTGGCNSTAHCPCPGLSSGNCNGGRTFYQGDVGDQTWYGWGTGDDWMLVEDGSCGNLEEGTAACTWTPPPGGAGPSYCSGYTPTTPVEGQTLKKWKRVACEQT